MSLILEYAEFLEKINPDVRDTLHATVQTFLG